MLLDGPMNGECSRTWIEPMLAPTLEPSDVVMMDNLPGHKVIGVRQAIEQRGAALLYLRLTRPISTRSKTASPSSRRSSARMHRGLIEADTAGAISQFTPTECANFFAHASYGSN
nr:transposase [Rhodopseudomonas palustris]